MKRLLPLFAALLISTAAFAQSADRDVLVTPNGTVYTVESELATDNASAASSYIEFTAQNGEAKTSVVIPDSTSAGTHTLPALAYDADSDTVFVVWMHMRNLMGSELLLSAWSAGAFQPAVSIDNQAYRFRYNLRLGISRRVTQIQPDGTTRDVPALLLHALWWEETGNGEEARYALMTIDHGKLASVETHSLSEFYGDSTVAPFDAAVNTEILRHPAFLDNGSSNSVEVLAGDLKSNSFHRVTVKPVLDTRIHIPVGRTPDIRVGAPRNLSADWSGHLSVINAPRGERIVVAKVLATGAVNYITWSNGNWSGEKTIATGAKLSSESALSALARMAANAD